MDANRNQKQGADEKLNEGKDEAKRQLQGAAEQVKGEAEAAAAEAKHKAEQVMGEAKDAAKGVVSDVKAAAKETTSYLGEQARAVGGEMANQAKSALQEGRSQVAGRVSGVASVFARASDELRQQDHPHLARYSEQVGERVERVANYLGERDLGEMLHDVESFARRHPMVFAGAAVALGVVIARVLRSRPDEAR